MKLYKDGAVLDDRGAVIEQLGNTLELTQHLVRDLEREIDDAHTLLDHGGIPVDQLGSRHELARRVGRLVCKANALARAESNRGLAIAVLAMGAAYAGWSLTWAVWR